MEKCHLQHARSVQKSVGYRQASSFDARAKATQEMMVNGMLPGVGRWPRRLARTTSINGKAAACPKNTSYACAPSVDRVPAFLYSMFTNGGVSSWASSEQPDEAMNRRIHSCYASRPGAINARGRRAA